METFPLTTPTCTAVRYRIDEHDVITEIGGAWDVFARENGGVVSVVGRNLWELVAGPEVQGIWQLLVRHVRTHGTPLTFLYRCDAPGLRRLMQMELNPDPSGGVSFCSRPVAVHEGTTFSGSWTGSNLDVVVCGWCARVHTTDWVTPDRAAAELGLTRPDAEWPRLSHGICRSCARQLRELVRA